MAVARSTSRCIAAGLLALGLGLNAIADDSSVTVASKDEVLLKNGSRILGTVTGTRDGVVTIDTEFAGTLSIEQGQIVSMATATPVVMQLADGSVVKEEPLRVVDGELLLSPALTPSSNYPLTDLLLVNPEPWELGEGYRWKGVAGLGFVMQRGNTDSDELDYKLESIWRSLEDRYTLRLVGESDESNGVKNTENWTLTGKYDRFLDGPWYWGLNAVAEQDKFSDLNLRYYAGPYLGRQFYEQPALTLSAELGLSYVVEDYIVAEDQEYPAANWSANMTSDYLGGDSRLYLDHVGIMNLGTPGDMILNTTVGLAFPLMDSIEAAAEVLLEYDSGVPDNVEELDQTYRFRIGYTW